MLTLISYNVMFNDILLEERHQALVVLLRKNLPDVICLQEVRSDAVSWFYCSLKDLYSSATSGLCPTGRDYGELIFIKKGIKQVSFECIPLPSKMGRALQHVKIKKGTEKYHIVTFHLESMNCSKVRRTQLDVLWQSVGQSSHLICCGDTNITTREKYMLSGNMRDAWEETDGKIGEFTYYSHRYWGGDRRQRYDKIWLSDDLQLTGFGVLGNKPLKELGNEWISDHDGLYLCVQNTLGAHSTSF